MKSLVLIPICLILFVMSCSSGSDKELSSVLDTRQRAFEEKDIKSYTDLIFTGYSVETRNGTKDRDDVIKEFRLNTTPFDKITMSHSDRSYHKEENSAKAVQKTSVILQIDDQKTNYEITEVILLVKENGEWKISKESSLDLFRGFVFGQKS